MPPFILPSIHADENRTHGNPFLRVTESPHVHVQRDPVTIYVHDHPELWSWLMVLVAAHKEVVDYIARHERDGVEFPK